MMSARLLVTGNTVVYQSDAAFAYRLNWLNLSGLPVRQKTS